MFGYFEERLRQDPRYKMATALGERGLLDTNAGRAVFHSAQPELGKTHALRTTMA